MSKEEIRVPDLGGSDEVEVIEISVSVGDTIAEEDPILVVESDKASVELPASVAGIIRELKVSIGDKVKQGDLVGFVDTEGGESADDRAEDSVEESADKAANKSASEDAGLEIDTPDQPEDASAGFRATSEPKTSGQNEDESAAPRSGTSRQETVRVPDIGGSENVPIIEIQVKEGDIISLEDPLVTLESDKASMDVPSPYAGTVSKLLVKVDDTVSEGDTLLEMTITEEGEEVGDDGATESSEARQPPSEKTGAQAASRSDRETSKEARPEPATTEEPAPTSGRVHAGPAARKVARELGADLMLIKGSGLKQRILKEDVQNYVKQQLKHSQRGLPTGTGGGLPGVKLPDFSLFGDIERRPMSRLHSMTADSMQRSWLNVPHVTQFEEADITDLEAFRKVQKGAGEQQGIKITPLPFLLKACAYALKAQPAFNVSLDMDKREVVQKHYVHIGLAVDTPAGLVVPVIRDVDKKSIWELAREGQELAAKARDKKLRPAEMQGSCFTITSLGGIGGTAFTPIINTPEVAILGVSKASMKPLWDGERFQPRLMLPLSLSYDHRAVNGAEAAHFTTLLKRLLEDVRELMM